MNPYISSLEVCKDGTQWYDAPYPQVQTISRYILRQKPVPSSSTALFTANEVFKSIIIKELCDIVLKKPKEKVNKLQKITINKKIHTIYLRRI